jgi:hypothetical protein
MLPGSPVTSATAPRPAAAAAVRHHRRVPPAAPPQPTEVCPGCGAVLVPVADPAPAHAGASPSCTRLFEDTLRGLREETVADPASGAMVRLADAAYDAQHPEPFDRGHLRGALETLGVSLEESSRPAGPGRPRVWRTTIADVAADLDVIDLPALVESWAGSVRDDWAGVVGARR